MSCVLSLTVLYREFGSQSKEPRLQLCLQQQFRGSSHPRAFYSHDHCRLRFVPLQTQAWPLHCFFLNLFSSSAFNAHHPIYVPRDFLVARLLISILERITEICCSSQRTPRGVVKSKGILNIIYLSSHPELKSCNANLPPTHFPPEEDPKSRSTASWATRTPTAELRSRTPCTTATFSPRTSWPARQSSPSAQCAQLYSNRFLHR